MPLVLSPDPAKLPELPSVTRKKMLLHPELRAALADYQAAEASLKLEVAKQYPTISLGPQFENDDGNASVGLGLAIRLPFFNTNHGGVIEAEIRREGTRDLFRSLLLRVSHAEAQARAEWNVTEQMLENYRSGALRNLDQARKSLDLRLQAGESNVLEVLAALRSLADARVRELDLQRKSATARFRAAVAGGAVLNDPPHSESGKEEK